jgi:hypothetical protein
VGVAETNVIEPTVPAATVTVPVAVRLVVATVADAVMTSGPLQPLAVYVALIFPVVVTTVSAVVPAVLLPAAATTASPWEIHVELKVTVTLPPVYSAAAASPVVLWTSVTVKLVVPPAERDELASAIIPDWKPVPLPLPISYVVVGVVVPLVPVPPVVLVVPVKASPPHAPSDIVIAAKAAIEKNLYMSHPCLCPDR